MKRLTIEFTGDFTINEAIEEAIQVATRDIAAALGGAQYKAELTNARRTKAEMQAIKEAKAREILAAAEARDNGGAE